MAVTSDYDNIISGMLPSLRTQQKGMHDYLAAQARRTGTAGAMRLAAQGVAPYAEKAGEAIGRTAPQIAQLKARERQFNIQRQQWEKQFEQNRQQQNLVNLMNLFGQTGVMTPEMMDAFGYGDMTRTQQRDILDQLQMLGFPGYENTRQMRLFGGANRPNPALQRLGLQGSGGGGASFGTLSSPSNPFRRVTDVGQGPGLMALT